MAENILEDLFTMVLDWHLSEVNNQVGYAGLVLTRLGVKHLIVEVNAPEHWRGTSSRQTARWHRHTGTPTSKKSTALPSATASCSTPATTSRAGTATGCLSAWTNPAHRPAYGG